MGSCHADSHIITISNIQDGETLFYSLPLIKGQIFTKNGSRCFNCTSGKIILHHYNGSSGLVSSTEWPVVNSEFKCLVSLVLEKNFLVLDYCGIQENLNIVYQPRRTTLRVTPVYIICHGHDGLFQAPNDIENTVPSACQRIALGARLIQSLTAEKLYEAKAGRKTFQLEYDLNRLGPECIVFRSQLPVERAKKMSPRDLWEHFGRELMTSPLGSKNRKFLAFLSCTRYNLTHNKQPPKTHEDILAAMEAHVALGGGGLAIFGSACLYSWPLQVEDVIPKFLDVTKVDTQNFMDDSCYRGTFGGCFATTLGSVCHELGHTFDLGHTADGIMGRGFDDVNLVFTVQQCEDNERNSCNGNRYVSSPIYKELAQHSTVAFTKVLNLSYTMSSPIKRPRSKSHGSRPDSTKSTNVNSRNSFTTSSTTESNRFNVGLQLNNTRNIESPERQNNHQIPMTFKVEKDCIHWSKNCAALLSFHRWFNDEVRIQEQNEALSFDEKTNVVSSPVGVRVVEIRDSSGLVLSSWQFLESGGVDKFIIPIDVLSEPSLSVVAEDSLGNIIKHHIL